MDIHVLLAEVNDLHDAIIEEIVLRPVLREARMVLSIYSERLKAEQCRITFLETLNIRITGRTEGVVFEAVCLSDERGIVFCFDPDVVHATSAEYRIEELRGSSDVIECREAVVELLGTWPSP